MYVPIEFCREEAKTIIICIQGCIGEVKLRLLASNTKKSFRELVKDTLLQPACGGSMYVDMTYDSFNWQLELEERICRGYESENVI
jgi:hypothetical protein